MSASADEITALRQRLTERTEDYATVLRELADAQQEIERLREALKQTYRRLWWFIERDHGDGNEVDAAEACAEAMAIQHDVIDPALQSPSEDAEK
jgi:D-serine deaminase-like pyridoxal phosphate-dependent protein